MFKYILFLIIFIISISKSNFPTYLNERFTKLNKELIGDFPIPLDLNKIAIS